MLRSGSVPLGFFSPSGAQEDVTATRVIKAMPLRWPFYPAFIGTSVFVPRPPIAAPTTPFHACCLRLSKTGLSGWVLRCFLREDFTVSFHVIVWNVALYMERFLPPFNVAVCYYGEVGADGSRLQLSGVKSGSR